MIPVAGDPFHWLFLAAGGVFVAGIVASLVRLLMGPTLPDRIVALDLIGFLVIGGISVYAIVTNRDALLFVALVGALILFLATAAFAIYVERRETK
jgi:multicomponent Na+:H+ antiporter subunit F